MMDWRSLAFSSLWVFAAALALAAVSHASWAAAGRGQKLGQVLESGGYQRSLALAGILFASGQAGNAEETWRLAAWCTLAGLFAWQLFISLRRGN